MGAALTKGSTENVIACVKHFALNSAENNRFHINIDCDEATLHDCYLPHFRQCLEEGGGESLMSAYNKINGEHCGENGYLLNKVVRSIWGLEDVVITSDWIFGFRDVPASIKAGLDVEMPHRSMRAKYLPDNIAKGTVAMADFDRIGKRIIRTILKYHVRIASSDKPPTSIVRSDPHRHLAKQAATQGMVVLENDGILPLHDIKRLLVVGRLATSIQTGDHGSSTVHGDKNIVSPLQGLEQREGVITSYLDGSDLAAVAKACDNADAVFVLAGYTGEDEGEGGMDKDGLKPAMMATVLPGWFPYTFVARIVLWSLFNLMGLVYLVKGQTAPRLGGDRSNLRLTKTDEEIITAVSQTAGRKMILGLEISGPVILPKQVRSNAAAIIVTGYGGCEFGNALREVLYGDAEPSGRLAYSIPEAETDIPDIDLQADTTVYGRFWGYRLLQQKRRRAAYPFGFGLGYGTVKFTSGSFKAPRKLDQRFFKASVSVRNAGNNKTTHVVQIYAGAKNGTSIDYQRVLIGFIRVQLAAGEERLCTVKCRLDPVAHYNTESQQFDVAQGDYNLFASSYEGDEESLVVVVPASRFSWSARVDRGQ
jgi:beta-glucosidase